MGTPLSIDSSRNRLGLSEAEAVSLIAEIRASNLTYCGAPKLENLVKAAFGIAAAGVTGCYVEAGVALGGSAILLARLKPADTRLDLYDVFGMIPPPGENDGPDAHARYEVIRSGASAGLGDARYYGYVEDLLTQVKDNLRRFEVDPQDDGLTWNAGLFSDTLHPAGKVALAHIDCDWYDSVRLCIERLTPVLTPGGMIVFDDYNSYSGCRRAVDELLAARPDFKVAFENRSIGLRLDPTTSP